MQFEKLTYVTHSQLSQIQAHQCDRRLCAINPAAHAWYDYSHIILCEAMQPLQKSLGFLDSPSRCLCLWFFSFLFIRWLYQEIQEIPSFSYRICLTATLAPLSPNYCAMKAARHSLHPINFIQLSTWAFYYLMRCLQINLYLFYIEIDSNVLSNEAVATHKEAEISNWSWWGTQFLRESNLFKIKILPWMAKWMWQLKQFLFLKSYSGEV